jgi:hypothetical protein
MTLPVGEFSACEAVQHFKSCIVPGVAGAAPSADTWAQERNKRACVRASLRAANAMFLRLIARIRLLRRAKQQMRFRLLVSVQFGLHAVFGLAGGGWLRLPR